MDRFLRIRNPPRNYVLTSNSCPTERRIESRAERILAKDADGKGIALRGRDLGRPFDKSAKIVEIGCFNLIFRGLLLSLQAWNRRQQPKQCGQRDAEARAAWAQFPTPSSAREEATILFCWLHECCSYEPTAILLAYTPRLSPTIS